MDSRHPLELRYARPKYQEPALVKRRLLRLVTLVTLGITRLASLVDRGTAKLERGIARLVTLPPIGVAVVCLCLGAAIGVALAVVMV